MADIQRGTPNPPQEQDPERVEPKTPGEREAADEGLPGYGQPPPGVRTDRLEEAPEYEWGDTDTGQPHAPVRGDGR